MAIRHICDKCGTMDKVTQHYFFTGHMDNETGYPEDTILDLCDKCFVELYLTARGTVVKEGDMLDTDLVSFEGKIFKLIFNIEEVSEVAEKE